MDKVRKQLLVTPKGRCCQGQSIQISAGSLSIIPSQHTAVFISTYLIYHKIQNFSGVVGGPFFLKWLPFVNDCRRKSTHLMFTDQLHTISMLPGNARYVIASFYDGNKTGRVRTAHPLLQTPLFLRTSLFSWPVIDRGASVTLCPLELRLFYVWNSFKVVRDSHSITCDVYYIIHYIILYITGMFPLS